MNFTDEILKTALLGTDKYPYAPATMLEQVAEKIVASQTDKEDGFLRYAATAFLFAECGREPQALVANVAACPSETHPFFTAAADSWVKSSLSTDDVTLLRYLIFKCNQRNEILPGELVPSVLNEALSSVSKAAPSVNACGELGQWLIGINPVWKPLSDIKAAEGNWETGSPNERKQFLSDLRMKEPQSAIPLLEATFPQENANVRAEFIGLMKTGLSESDIPFLERQLSDKAKKVKEAAQDLLKGLKGSQINRLYEDYLFRALTVKEQRVLIFGKKKVIEINHLIQPAESLFEMGLEKVSSTKGVLDHHHWMQQVLGYVSPGALLAHLQMSLDEFLDLVQKDTAAEHFIHGLANAAVHFRNAALAKGLMQRNMRNSVQLLHVIPLSERGPFYAKMGDSHLSELLSDQMDAAYSLIPSDLAMMILKGLSAAPYTIIQHTYRRLALHLSPSMIPKLKDFAKLGSDDNPQLRYFSTQVSEMIRLLEIKESLNL